jgi:C4-dicarboxylate transporter DctQ subunit
VLAEAGSADGLDDAASGRSRMKKPLLDRFEEGSIIVLLTMMTVITFTQVVLRYVFNSGFIWALEATTTCFAWLVMLAISYCFRVNAHLGVTLVVSRLSPSGRKIAGMLAVLACLIYVGLLLWGGVVFVRKLHILGSFARDLPVPRWVLALGLPIGLCMTAYRLFQVAADILAGQRDGLAPAHAHESPQVRTSSGGGVTP